MATSVEEKLCEKVRALPPDQQQAVLDFAESLTTREQGAQPRKSLYGLCADLRTPISVEEIRELRREMWSGFPREISKD